MARGCRRGFWRDSDPPTIVSLLEGIDGACERAQLGRRQAHTGDTVALDDL
ncbi:MAG: hypothetical protein KY460_12115 [Actinobacteria bacterium]|nr:hypothetical protein [Actinomycetota bacterium]